MHSLALAITLVVGILAAFVAVAIALPRTRTPESVVSTLPPEVLDRVRALLGAFLQALLDDGRIDADEAEDLREELLDGLREFGGAVSVTEAVKWLGARLREALDRNPVKMRARATKLDARGMGERAAKVRARADEVERHQAAPR